MNGSTRGTTSTAVTDNVLTNSAERYPLPMAPVTCCACDDTIESEFYTGYMFRAAYWCPECVGRLRQDWRRLTCPTCGRVFHAAISQHEPRRYCTQACYVEAARLRAARKRGTNPDRTCTHCGEPFTGRADARYCGTRCRVAAHRAKPRPLARVSATSATPQHQEC